MKLLLDEMWPYSLAIALRRRGHDVSAVTERPELSARPDAEILVIAQSEGRAVVTENVADYRRLAAEVLGRGESHAGLIFTSNRRFPRHDPRTTGRLVSALDAWLSICPTVTNVEHWLT